MNETDPKALFTRAIKSIDSGDMVVALAAFEKLAGIEDTPINRSYLAFCIAKERGQFKKAISMCEESIREEPGNPVHYLNLGRVCLLANNKTEAMRVFREGLNHGENREIVEELSKIGIRRPPVIPFLKRESLINKYVGLALSKLGMR